MGDIRDPRLLYLKGCLFLILGTLAGAMLIRENPGLRTVLLLAITVWAFARAYYFAFYVIEHYIDSQYRFAGLGSFLRYLASRRTSRGKSRSTDAGADSNVSPDDPAGG